MSGSLLNSFLLAPAIMTGIGLFFGALIAISRRLLQVDEDPRIEGTYDLLPGTNCGACGQPGCLPFAQKLVTGDTSPGQCTVSTKDQLQALADFLDVDAGQQDKKVARLKCAGGSAQAHQIAEYRGFEGCRAAALVSGGGKGCSWGCLGLGDCELACQFEAIHINTNGLPQVDPDKCVACPDCTNSCPRDLFEVVSINHQLYVQCNSPLTGEAATRLCHTACDACGKCAADAAPGLISMTNGLPHVHWDSELIPSIEATYRCPTQAIVWLSGAQFNNVAEVQHDPAS